MQNLEIDLDAIHKALANPLRREILLWLKYPEAYFTIGHYSLNNGVCAGQINERSGLSQSTVSAHLAILQKAGLVQSTRVGQWIFFQRNEAVVRAFLAHMQGEL